MVFEFDSLRESFMWDILISGLNKNCFHILHNDFKNGELSLEKSTKITS